MDLKTVCAECEKIIDYMNNNFDDFPNGACGRTSRLLAYVLQDRYDINCINIISATLKINPMQSHAWVWADGYIIDLTISQFNDKLNLNYPVIYISADSNDYNNIFDYGCFNSLVPIYEGCKESDISGYYSCNNYEFKQKQEIIINYNEQDLGL